METATRNKALELDRILGEMGSVVVAYSGGVDSSFLADRAHRVLGGSSLAVTAVSPSLARRELTAATALATERGWNHRTVGTHEVAREEYARNDPDRCYWCKVELYTTLGPIASQREAQVLVGTNVDDLGDYRPGHRAADENGVAAPFLSVGLSKDEIRSLSAEAGLPTADKPASPCLASRFAYGVRVTPEGLRRVDRAEEIVRSHGFTIFRVRDHGELARIEVPSEDLPRAFRLRDRLGEQLRALGYDEVTLDLRGFRSGSMNGVLKAPTLRRA